MFRKHEQREPGTLHVLEGSLPVLKMNPVNISPEKEKRARLLRMADEFAAVVERIVLYVPEGCDASTHAYEKLEKWKNLMAEDSCTQFGPELRGNPEHGYDESPVIAGRVEAMFKASDLDEDILDEAKRITSTDRNDLYGEPEQNFSRIAKMWSVILGTTITARDVGLMMIAMKVARDAYKPTRDGLVDIAGYARCISLLPE
jgi:hypothetical protein